MVKSFTKTAWSCLLCAALVLSPLSMGGSGVGVGFYKAEAQQYIPGLGMVIYDPPGYEHGNHWANACLYRRTSQSSSAQDKYEELFEKCEERIENEKKLGNKPWAGGWDCDNPCDIKPPVQATESTPSETKPSEEGCQTAEQIIDDLFHPFAAAALKQFLKKGRTWTEAGGIKRSQQIGNKTYGQLAQGKTCEEKNASVDVNETCNDTYNKPESIVWVIYDFRCTNKGSENFTGNAFVSNIFTNESSVTSSLDGDEICTDTFFAEDRCTSSQETDALKKRCKALIKKWEGGPWHAWENVSFNSQGIECPGNSFGKSAPESRENAEPAPTKSKDPCSDISDTDEKKYCQFAVKEFDKLCKAKKAVDRAEMYADMGKKSKTEATVDPCPGGYCSPKIRWHDRLFGALPGILGAGLMAWSGREAVRTNARLGWPTDPSAAFSMGFPYLMSGIYGAAYGSRGSLCGPNGIHPGMFSGMGPFGGGNFNFGMNPFGGFNGGMGPFGMNPFAGSHLMNPFGGGFNPGGMNPLYAGMFPGMMGGLGNPFGGLGGGLMGGLGPFGGNIGGVWPGMGGLGGFGGLGGLQGQLQLQMQQMQLQAAQQQQALMSRYMQEQQRKGMIVGNLYQQIQRLQMQIQGVLNSGVGGQFGFGGGLGGQWGGGGFLGNPTAILPGPGSAGAGAGGTGSYPLMNNILGQ